MSTEKTDKKINKGIVIAVVSAAVVIAAVIAVLLLIDGYEPSASGTDTSSGTVTTVDADSFASGAESDAPDTYIENGENVFDIEFGKRFSSANETVTAKELTNLRAEPATDAELTATLKNGDTALRTGISDDGWSRLEYNGQTVYAVSGYLTTDLSYKPVEIPGADVVEGNTFEPHSDSVTAKELTNLRALPTTNSEIVGTLVSGDFLERTAISDKGWSRLVYNGQTVYAVTSYLSNEVVPPYVAPDGFDAVDELVTAKSETNLRTAPSVSDTDIVYILKNGEYVRRIAVNTASGWSKLEWNGQTVYAITSYLEIKSEADTTMN